VRLRGQELNTGSVAEKRDASPYFQERRASVSRPSGAIISTGNNASFSAAHVQAAQTSLDKCRPVRGRTAYRHAVGYLCIIRWLRSPPCDGGKVEGGAPMIGSRDRASPYRDLNGMEIPIRVNKPGGRCLRFGVSAAIECRNTSQVRDDPFPLAFFLNSY
jgi:hypothetical protein